MELVEGKNCWIDPTKREAKAMAQCLMNQGDMRGFVIEEKGQEPYLIVFDSYGNTHSTAMVALGLGRRTMDIETLIFWKNGGILVDSLLPKGGRMRASDLFTESVAEVLDAIARGSGHQFAWVTNDEFDVIK